MKKETFNVRISTCPKCKGVVSMAVANYLIGNQKANRDFMKEAADHQLDVSTTTHAKAMKIGFCFERCGRKAIEKEKVLPQQPTVDRGGFHTIPSKANNVNWDDDDLIQKPTT